LTPALSIAAALSPAGLAPAGASKGAPQTAAGEAGVFALLAALAAGATNMDSGPAVPAAAAATGASTAEPASSPLLGALSPELISVLAIEGETGEIPGDHQQLPDKVIAVDLAVPVETWTEGMAASVGHESDETASPPADSEMMIALGPPAASHDTGEPRTSLDAAQIAAVDIPYPPSQISRSESAPPAEMSEAQAIGRGPAAALGSPKLDPITAAAPASLKPDPITAAATPSETRRAMPFQGSEGSR
jgi:hypothetical protein